MSLLAWIVFGFVAGLLARAILPGSQRMGIIRTTLLGVAGSFVGGGLASVLTHRSYLVIHPTGLLGSVAGAVVLLVVAGLLRRD